MNPPPLSDSNAPPARERLLHAGLRLFADQGYAKTSTRELAETAGVNVASISYYFGDKAGLYRAVFSEPQANVPPPDAVAEAGLPLREALQRFYAGFLEPLRQGELAQLCTKLHFREMLEPSGLWADQVPGEDIRPMHEALVRVLARAVGLPAADDALLRLAVSLEALGVHQHVGRDITERLAPGLYTAPDAIDRWRDTLVEHALSMVDGERARRAAR